MPHLSPAQHKPKTTSYATVLSITHHTKGANLPWFLNLPLDECIDQHTLTNSIPNKVGLNHAKTLRKRLGPSRQRQTARHSRDAKSSRKRKAEMRKASSKAETQLKVSNTAETSRTPPEPHNSPLKAEIKAESSKQAENQISIPLRQKSANSP